MDQATQATESGGFARARADLWAFARYVARRFVDDQGLQTAASLTYTSLLGLVPLLAVFLAILAAFPAFEDLREDVKGAILAPFAPGASSAVTEHLDIFLENTRQLGVVGALGIGVTAILMLNTIEKTLNRVWRVQERRTLKQRLVIFWALLTLPPILIAASVSISSYFSAVAGGEEVARAAAFLRELGPFLMQWIAFAILFTTAPNRHVRLKDGLIGGLIAGALFEGLKNVFGFYVKAAGSQEAIYGALAAIPFFLLWIYATWTMILVGAETAAALPEWRRAIAGERRRALSSGERLSAAIGLLALLWRRTAAREPIDRDEVETALPADAADLGRLLDRLIDLGYAAETATGQVVLARDLAETSVYDLQRDLGLALEQAADFCHAVETHAPAARGAGPRTDDGGRRSGEGRDHVGFAEVHRARQRADQSGRRRRAPGGRVRARHRGGTGLNALSGCAATTCRRGTSGRSRNTRPAAPGRRPRARRTGRSLLPSCRPICLRPRSPERRKLLRNRGSRPE